jgi:hypothetical protein
MLFVGSALGAALGVNIAQVLTQRLRREGGKEGRE